LVCEKQDTLLHFHADSDAHIVRGLLSIILMMYSNKTAEQIIGVDAKSVFKELGLDQHLSPSRANGLNSMVGRIQAYAQSHAS
jgi:cysteine desulfuration protein SufE